MDTLSNIYKWNYGFICLLALLLELIWVLLKLKCSKRLFKGINITVLVFALYAIMFCTVLFRESSSERIYCFAVEYNDEFCREMIMNAFLYFPLGLSLTSLVGPLSFGFVFGCSFFVEIWQYCVGTGLAQGTDVIMNTLGCVIGGIPWFVNRAIEKRKGKEDNVRGSNI